MKQKSKLKPCPFCGSPAEVSPAYFGRRGSHKASCQNDRCFVMPHGFADTKRKAIDRWNMRHESITKQPTKESAK